MKGVLSRVLRGCVAAVLVLAVVWYVWALLPTGSRPPGAGKLFTKPVSIISRLSSQVKIDPSPTPPVPVSEIKSACDPFFLLKPLQGPADHVVIQVAVGFDTVERNVSCVTHLFTDAWHPAP